MELGSIGLVYTLFEICIKQTTEVMNSRQLRSKTIQLDQLQSVMDEKDKEDGLIIQVSDDVPTSTDKELEEEEINKRLRDIGMLEEGMSLKEKNDILQLVNESVSTAKHEDDLRKNVKRDVLDTDVSEIINQYKEEWNVTSTSSEEPKTNSEMNCNNTPNLTHELVENPSNCDKGSSFLGKRKLKESFPIPDSASCKLNISDKTDVVAESTPEKLRKTSNDSQTINVIDTKSDNTDIVVNSSSDEDTFISKKRHTSENVSLENLKRFKMDKVNTSDIKKKQLLECLAKKNIVVSDGKPRRLRNIDSIIKELDSGREAWKKAMSRIKFPVMWAKPIIPQGSGGIVSGDHIPEHLLKRYQQYLRSNNLKHSIFGEKSSFSSEFSDTGGVRDSESFSLLDEDINSNSCGKEGSSQLHMNKVNTETEPSILDPAKKKRAATSTAYKESSDSGGSDGDEWINPKAKSNRTRGIIRKGRKKGLSNQPIPISSQKNMEGLQSSHSPTSSFNELFNQVTDTSASSNTHTTRSSSRRINQLSQPVVDKNAMVPCPVCSQSFTAANIETQLYSTSALLKTLYKLKECKKYTACDNFLDNGYTMDLDQTTFSNYFI